MEIEVTQEKLAKALNSVSRIAVGKVTLPVLNNVLIRVDNGKVSLITTNLDMATQVSLPVVSSKDGVITVPAKLLAEFISNLPRGEKIKLTAKDTKITITTGKYSSVINGSLADDFPALPEIDEKNAVTFKMGVDEFKDGVSQVMVASSNDLSRPALTGVYFNTHDKILAIASTDGYRLAEKKLIKNIQSEINVIVPANSLREVLAAINDGMEEIEISFNENLVRFCLGDVEVISNLIDASYPDYRRLFPKESNIKVNVGKDEFLRVVKLAALFARRSAGGAIVCETKKPNIFSVKAVANELGENDSIIETEVAEEGKITLNSRFLIDALNSLSEDKIELKFSNQVSPLVLSNQKGEDYTHIIMPLSS